MQNKDIVIIALIVVTIYLYYQQNSQKTLTIQPVENTELQELQNQVQHYQKLYQSRVEKDLSSESKIKETNQAYLKKIDDLETSLLNLAKQKIKGKKEAQELLSQLENNWKKDKDNWANQQKKWQQDQQTLQQLQNFHQLVEKSSGPSLNRDQVNQAEALVEQITQPEIKQLASWMITDSAFILGHNNLLTKLADQEDKLEELREKNNSLTRKNQDLTEGLKKYQQEKTKQDQDFQKLNEKNIKLQQSQATTEEKLEEEKQNLLTIHQQQIQELKTNHRQQITQLEQEWKQKRTENKKHWTTKEQQWKKDYQDITKQLTQSQQTISQLEQQTTAQAKVNSEHSAIIKNLLATKQQQLKQLNTINHD